MLLDALQVLWLLDTRGTPADEHTQSQFHLWQPLHQIHVSFCCFRLNCTA